MFFSEFRTKKPPVQPAVGRSANLKSPARATSNPERRVEGRADLNVGILVVPIRGDSPDISQAFAAITKDLSATGAGVIANRFISTPEVLLCLSGKSETKLLRALVRYRKELGSGWVRFGMEITDTLDKSEYPQIGQFIASVLC
jgi:hypothetical protein